MAVDVVDLPAFEPRELHLVLLAGGQDLLDLEPRDRETVGHIGGIEDLKRLRENTVVIKRFGFR